MRVGVCQVDITPPLGHWMGGYPGFGEVDDVPVTLGGYVGRHEPGTGSLDPLWAKAVVFESGNERLALVVLDTLVVIAPFTRRIRQVARNELGILPNGVLVSATHTHSGADVFGLHSPNVVELEERIFKASMAALRGAVAGLVEGELAFASAMVNGLQVNRCDPAMPTDPYLGVLRVGRSDGSVAAIIVNYACHPISLDYSNLSYSADYCASLYETVEREYPGASCVFLNGCAGDINPRRFPYSLDQNIYVDMTPENYPVHWGGEADARRFGRILGRHVLNLSEQESSESDLAIGVQNHTVRLPIVPMTERTRFRRFFNMSERYASRMMEWDAELETEIQVLEFGPYRLVGLPGEPFAQIGLRIRDSVAAPTLVLGYCNDDVRYIPTESTYRTPRYETFATWVGPGGAERLVDLACDMLQTDRERPPTQ